MKTLIMLLLPIVMCSACAALPAEERAFAVALCVEKDDVWRVHGRIPTYQAGGGYTTVTGEGESISAALSDMDAAAPMRINLSQVRLLVADAELAKEGALSGLLTAWAERPDMRMQCAVALTDAPVKAVADALTPAAGSRLSKALDLMLDARIEQGSILPATLADMLRMGERQSPVLIALALEGQKFSLSGGYTMDGVPLTPEETALLSMLLGHAKAMRMNLPGGSADVRDASASISLSAGFNVARVELTMSAVASSFTEDGLEQAIADAAIILLTRLSDVDCDVLGLGRQAIVRIDDMAQWHALNWPERYRGIRWEVAVGVNGAA